MRGPYPVVDALIRNKEAAALKRPGVLAAFIGIVTLLLENNVDPHPLVQSLIEGLAATVSANIPEETRDEIAVEVVRLLRERLIEYRAI